MTLKVKIKVTKKNKKFFFLHKFDFLTYGRYQGPLPPISNLGHSVNRDPQQRTKHGNFLLTSEVNISETVADTGLAQALEILEST